MNTAAAPGACSDKTYKTLDLKNTNYEADVDSSGNCRSRDGLSTWDAGNLGATERAVACTWSHVYEGKKNDLREADVRYNTSDFDFTDYPTSSCYRKHDVRGIGTHEAGHVGTPGPG
ncbi:hypothetical protein ACFWM7_34405 [Streptomyces sp. NPDC058375]|uniref:hypothetical protein n=1 Tax=Streptomyces sp. NPDC058375 TaxID=3346467 RepID=UPI00366826A9